MQEYLLGVSIRSSTFSIISKIILSLVTCFYLVKWFLRFPPLKFWTSVFRIGTTSLWNFKIVVVPTLLQLSFSCGIAIIGTPFVAFSGCCNLCCCCCNLGLAAAVVPLALISRYFLFFFWIFIERRIELRIDNIFWLVSMVPILSFTLLLNKNW